MKKSIKKQILLALLLFSSFTITTYPRSCDSCCACTCGIHDDCPCTCRPCYDCINPCDCSIHPCKGAPFLQYRSQSLNKAKELAGWTPFINCYGKKDTYGCLYTSLEFTTSFRSNWIAHYLFGDDLVNNNCLVIQGSAVENRHPKAWLADYFGLPIDFESIVTFCPKIKNIILDLNTYIGLDRVTPGLFVKFYFPIASTRWDCNMSECIKVQGQEPFPVGYMSAGTAHSADPIPRDQLPSSFIDAVQIGTTWGDQQQSMFFGTIPCMCLERTRFSDIHMDLGYNFILKENYNLGASVHVVFPTGNRPTARYLFEPIVGNGKHWELGLGITGQWVFWQSAEWDDTYMGIYLDAVVTHMFKTCQARSFDFCKKPNSRYMLLVQMTPDEAIAESSLITDYPYTSRPADYTYATFEVVSPCCTCCNCCTCPCTSCCTCTCKTCCDCEKNLITGLTPAINYTTRVVDVSVALQADIAIKFSYKSDTLCFDIGYDFWVRTREKITPCKDYCKHEPEPRYVIKGDALLWAQNIICTEDPYDSYCDSDTIKICWHPLSGSQCQANIHTGMNMILRKKDPLSSDADRNKCVDNADLAWIDVKETDCYPAYVAEKHNWPKNAVPPEPPYPYPPIQIGEQVYSSFDPILLSPLNLDTCQSAPAMTHKMFAHINYEWRNPERRWRPFAGLGGEAEFAPKNMKYRAISQWGIWVKAGVAFQ